MAQVEFDSYYSKIFKTRWPELKAALLAPNKAVEYDAGLVEPYHMDSASVEAAMALRLPDRGEILDACAAPGGKTLVLASRLANSHKKNNAIKVLANELSSDRRRRLSSVLDKHLDYALRSLVIVTGFDAAQAGSRPSERNRFDAILLDAPCSSERHIIASQHALEQWTPSRIKFLAQRQWALLSSAFLMLKTGGSLVYSTCALTEAENDAVINRLLKKYPNAEIENKSASIGAEETIHGLQFFPDKADGAGPLYISKIKKS